MNIPFSPPYIDKDVLDEVLDTLQSGWITTGPKVKALEKLSAEIAGVQQALCINSWTSGAMLVMKWLGIKEGDEVIMPAYTYAATALAVLHAGAKPVMVDVLDDFTINPEAVRKAITPATKAVITVDIAGWPCDYNSIKKVLKEEVDKFVPANEVQQKLERPLLMADAAHSFGAVYYNKPASLAADITVFSLHAVKNITTAEGGVIALNLSTPFDNEAVYKWMRLNAMNGQTADALTKTQKGNWRYDIVSDGLKINLTDVCAAIGLAQMRKYKTKLLPDRKRIFNHYSRFFATKDWAIVPPAINTERESSYHLYLLRIRGVTEVQRDKIIQLVADAGAAVNVHFVPLPMLTLFREMGYEIANYPVAFDNYHNEISLPIYSQLTDEQCTFIEEQIEKAYNAVVK